MGSTAKNYHEQGGERWVVGGVVDIVGDGQIQKDGQPVDLGGGGGGTSDAHMYGYDGTTWRGVAVDEQGKQAVTTIDASVEQVTIAAGSNLSSAVDLSRKILTALVIPAGYDGGHITIQGSDTLDGTYVDVYDSTGTSIMIGVYGASRIVAIVGYAMQAIASLNYIKIKTTSNVAAARTVGIITKG